MKDIYANLPYEKKKRIMDACIEEFAEKGYDKASTNSIVKKAGISKGALFNYFGNKKNLYLYVVDYCIDFLMNKFSAVKYTESLDIFQRFIKLSFLKMKIYSDEPLISKLVVSAFISMPDELKEELTERYTNVYARYTPQLFEGIDTSMFREDIDPQKAVELINIFLNGLAAKYLKLFEDRPVDEIFNNIDKLLKEFDEYLKILKYGMCK